jgi:hypothetical protein
MGYSAMWLAVYLLLVMACLGLILAFSYRRWQRLTERERFLLGMKKAARPQNMDPDEKSKLKLLRSPWWALWRWLPDLWHRPPPLWPSLLLWRRRSLDCDTAAGRGLGSPRAALAVAVRRPLGW